MINVETVPDEERAKPKQYHPDWASIVARLRAGETIRLRGEGLRRGSIISASRYHGIRVHVSVREDGFVVWFAGERTP